MSKSALLVLLLAAGAFGVGYFTATTTTSTPNLPEDPWSDMGGSDVSTERANTLIGGSADGTSSSGPSLQNNPQADDLAPIRQAVSSYEGLALVRGEGTISGTILTDEGEGLGGVKVIATPVRDRPPMPHIEDLEERLLRSMRRQIEHHHWLRANIVETTTDSSGNYLLEGLMDREHQLSARREGWNVRPRDWNRSRKARPGPDPHAFVARPRSGVRLELTQPDGTPISRARIEFHRQGDSRRNNRRQWNSSRPEFEATPGAYRLEVIAGEYNHLYSGPLDIEIPSGEITPLRVDLKERPVLVLTISFAEGEEMGGRLYHLPADSSERPTDVELKTRGTEKGMWAAAGQKPRHVLEGIKSRYVAVGFTRAYRGRLEAVDVIQLKDGINKHTLEVPALGAGAAMKVRVHTHGGEPVTNASITARFNSKTNQAWGASSAHKGSGEYLVVHPEGAGNGTYTLTISAPGHGEKQFEYDPGNTSVFDARFDPPAKLVLQIEDMPTTAGTIVAVLNTHPRRGRGQELEVDGEGKVVFAGTQPGTYRLELHMGPRRGRRKTVHAQELDLESGERTLSIPMPELHTVTIRGATGNISVRQQIKSRDRNARRRAYSEWKRPTDGEAVFADLPSGEYQARSGRKRATFRVPGTSTVVLEEPK